MPHVATREPRIGFSQLALDWWDRHLKGIDAPDIAPVTVWTGERWCAVAETRPLLLALNGVQHWSMHRMIAGIGCPIAPHCPLSCEAISMKTRRRHSM